MGTELQHLPAARRELELARSSGELRAIKDIGDLADAARRFAVAQGSAEESRRFAGELALDAKRYLGEILARQENRGRPSENLDRDEVFSAPPRLSELGLTYDQSSKAQQLAAIPEEDYQQFKQSANSDTLNVKRALRVAREKRSKEQRESEAAVAVLPPDIDLRCGDLRDALDDLPDGSVDAIITDPPYPAEFIELFDALGAVAARILRPGGLLVAMTGQTHLPAYMERLGRHLTYRWCGAYLTDGPATRIHGRKVGTKWKPLLLYGGDRFITQDVFTSDRDDKDHHHWGQSEAGMADIVDRLTEPGELVCDPFLGGGTTALVCRDLGRRFIGCDIDEEAITTARARLA